MQAAERAAIAEMAERYSVPREVHPMSGVIEQYRRYAGQVTYLERLVNDLEPEELFWGIESETDRRNPDDGDGERLRTGAAAEFEVRRRAGPSAKLEQFDKVQREYAKLGVDIIKLGLESAAQATGDRFGAQMAAVVQQILTGAADAVVERLGLEAGEAVELVRVFQPIAVAQIAAFAGVPIQTVEGSVMA